MKTNQKSAMSALMLGAIGVVFGDIGTSPLYSLKQCFTSGASIAINDVNMMGLLSLIFWALTLVVSVKYVVFVMKADNEGEGGIMSLMSLANRVAPRNSKSTLIILGLFGAALFYGDGVITPAISVLSAVEGLELVKPSLSTWILPIAASILFLLFFAQKSGTAKIGRFFGPIMIVWFSVLTLMGIYHIIDNVKILLSLNPYYALHFVATSPKIAFIVFGSIFLVLTGAEALYADMGHFGKKPINQSWFFFVFPSLVINYFGQGAMILKNPKLIDDPFYSMVPHHLVLPLVILSTLATIIASQAVISGAFSMTRQAVQLGFLPRVNIVHTSEKEMGQIYVPFINWSLFICVAALLFIFKSSDNLANAYGMAVVTTMVITNLLLAFVAKYGWKWSNLKVAALICLFLVFDAVFFASNMLKFAAGGWLPVSMGIIIFSLMKVWKSGTDKIHEHNHKHNIDLSIIPHIINDGVARVDGTAIFLSAVSGITPPAFMHNLTHNKVIHENVFFMTFKTANVPYLHKESRLEVEEIAPNFHKVITYIGFKESPDMNKTLKNLSQSEKVKGWVYDEMSTSFFISRETIVSKNKTFSSLKMRMFAWMSRNSVKAGEYFSIPQTRLIELGSQITLD